MGCVREIVDRQTNLFLQENIRLQGSCSQNKQTSKMKEKKKSTGHKSKLVLPFNATENMLIAGLVLNQCLSCHSCVI